MCLLLFSLGRSPCTVHSSHNTAETSWCFSAQLLASIADYISTGSVPGAEAFVKFKITLKYCFPVTNNIQYASVIKKKLHSQGHITVS